MAGSGAFIPANSPIILNFYGRGVNNVPAADQDYLSLVLVPGYILVKPIKIAYDYTRSQNMWANSSISSNISISARIYSYQ